MHIEIKPAYRYWLLYLDGYLLGSFNRKGEAKAFLYACARERNPFAKTDPRYKLWHAGRKRLIAANKSI